MDPGIDTFSHFFIKLFIEDVQLAQHSQQLPTGTLHPTAHKCLPFGYHALINNLLTSSAQFYWRIHLIDLLLKFRFVLFQL